MLKLYSVTQPAKYCAANSAPGEVPHAQSEQHCERDEEDEEATGLAHRRDVGAASDDEDIDEQEHAGKGERQDPDPLGNVHER